MLWRVEGELNMLAFFALVLAAQQVDSVAPRPPARTIAVDERLASDAGLRLGELVVVAPAPGAPGDTVRIGAFVKRRADPSEIARAEYRVRMHLDELQSLIGYGDRVDRFAVSTRGEAGTDSVLSHVNGAAFGFHAYRSKEIAVETSQTFAVVSRFHRAIGVITIVASSAFLLCIMLLKVEERRRDVAALRLMGISAKTIVRAVVLEAALIAVVGSVAGIAIGEVASAIVNWHYRGVYRTPLAFALVTPGTLVLAVSLSLVLGLGAGWLAARRLTQVHPLTLFGR